MGSESEFQIVGAENENDLQPYFFNIADGKALNILYLIQLYMGSQCNCLRIGMM